MASRSLPARRSTPTRRTIYRRPVDRVLRRNRFAFTYRYSLVYRQRAHQHRYNDRFLRFAKIRLHRKPDRRLQRRFIPTVVAPIVGYWGIRNTVV